MNIWLNFLIDSMAFGATFIYGSTGEILTEKAGHLNLGIPGEMYVGAISGVVGSFFYEQAVNNRVAAFIGQTSPELTGAALTQLQSSLFDLYFNPFLAVLIPLLYCLGGALLMGLIYCFLTVTLRANQNVAGLALTTFGVGIGNFFGGSLIKLSGAEVPSIALSATSRCFHAALPFAGQLGWFGQIFLSYGFLAYIAVIIALTVAYVLNHTRVGLHLRAVGENPNTADAAGINVSKYKYVATCIGSMIAGLGGLYYVMDYASGVWTNDAFGDRGWLAIALVIFTVWRPNVGVLASFLFGGLYILHMYIPSGMNLAVKELYKMAPYVVTIIVLVLSSMRNKRENQPPASLGLAYFREER
jgi:simple sugar transport system permease protein